MRNILFGSVVLTASLALAACGGGADDAVQDTQGTASTASSDSADTAQLAGDDPVEEVAEAIPADAAFADLTGDAAAGEAVYVKCRVCHLMEEGKNGVGPSLYGIIGREAGKVEGFANYSDAVKNSGITWSEEELFAFVENPREHIAGNRMAFPGVRDAQQRADLIAYLATNGE